MNPAVYERRPDGTVIRLDIPITIVDAKDIPEGAVAVMGDGYCTLVEGPKSL